MSGRVALAGSRASRYDTGTPPAPGERKERPLTDPHQITAIDLWPLDIPLNDPFVVATGSRVVAENAFVRLTLADGNQGYGEMAPLPEVGGETRSECLGQAQILGQHLLGASVLRYRALASRLAEEAPGVPAARCGLETALLDAFCRSANIPLWGLWGGMDVRPHETDITIPIADAPETLRLAQGWYALGFRLFKMKVGHDVDTDVRRLEAVHQACPGIAFILDANQGYSRTTASAAVKGVRDFGGQIVLLEQPVPREDLDAMAALQREWRIPVAADESVRSCADLRAVIRGQAATFVNIKITKTGVIPALDIAEMTRGAGLRLMVGGMVETRLAMGCSFGLVMGLGGFEVLDLDTPLLLANDPCRGGYRYEGPRLLPWKEAGLGMTLAPPANAIRLA